MQYVIKTSNPDFPFQIRLLGFEAKEIRAEFISQITSVIDDKVTLAYNLPCNRGDPVYELCLEEDISVVEHPVLE